MGYHGNTVPYNPGGARLSLIILRQSEASEQRKIPQDTKKEEFRKYLEKAGVLDLLTKSLVQLYEEPQKPDDALGYLKKSVGGNDDKTIIADLRKENDDLKKKISDLENERSSLKEKVSNLESKSMDTAAPAETAPAVETPAAVAEEGTTESAPEPAKEPEKKPEEKKEDEEPMDTTAAETPAAPAADETPAAADAPSAETPAAEPAAADAEPAKSE